MWKEGYSIAFSTQTLGADSLILLLINCVIKVWTLKTLLVSLCLNFYHVKWEL